MDAENNIPVRIQTIKQLESVIGGLSVLAELAMRQGEYVAAKKFRDGIALAERNIERLKTATPSNGSL